MLASAVSAGAVLAVALGIGFLLCGPRRPHVPISAWFGSAALAGLCAVAFFMHAGSAVGLPAIVLQSVVFIGAAAGGWRALRTPAAARASTRDEALAILPVLILCTVPLLLAISGPPRAYDVLGAWWPASLEVATEGTASPTVSSAYHLHPEYPRGLAWLFALGGFGAVPDVLLLRLLSFLFWPLTALMLMDVGARRGMFRSGWLAGLIVLALPEMPAVAASGLADVPLAGALALAAAGLTLARTDSAGWWMAAAGGLGAAAFKDEGLVVWLAVCLYAGVLVLQGQATRKTVLPLLLLPLGVVVAWWRNQGDPSSLSALQTIADQPAFLLGRLDALPGLAWDRLTHHWSGIAGLSGSTSADGWTSVLIMLLALMVIGPRGPRGFVAFPAVVLVLAHWCVVLMTFMNLQVQIDSTAHRLAIQVVPALAAASCDRLFGVGRDRTPALAAAESATPEPAA